MFRPIAIGPLTFPLISIIIAVVGIAVVIIYFIVMQFARRSLSYTLEDLFNQGRYDEFLDKVDSASVRAFFPEFNREYLRLNAYIAQGNTSEARKSLDRLLTMKTSVAMRDDLLVTAYRFYMKQKDYKSARAVLDEMENSGRNKEQVAACTKMWDIYRNKSYAYIDEMKTAFKYAQGQRKIDYAKMIATQYSNKKDREQADAWREIVRSLSEGEGQS